MLVVLLEGKNHFSPLNYGVNIILRFKLGSFGAYCDKFDSLDLKVTLIL